jgi:hypothetical protein
LKNREKENRVERVSGSPVFVLSVVRLLAIEKHPRYVSYNGQVATGFSSLLNSLFSVQPLRLCGDLSGSFFNRFFGIDFLLNPG